MKLKTIISLVLTLFIFACDFTSPGVYTEYSRKYSPDSSRFILKYNYEQGAWDGGRTWFVDIFRASDTARKNPIYGLSNLDFDDIYWKGNDTVVVAEKFTQYLSEGAKLKDTLTDGIYIKVIHIDPIDTSYSRRLILEEISPNRNYKLAVYRYVRPGNGYYFLNISIVPVRDSIPKFGNFYVSKYDFDCFENIQWDSTNALDILVSESCYYAFRDYLVKNAPAIKYKVHYDETDSVRRNIHPPGE